MKLGSWRLGTHKATAAASQLVPALDRVREMREHSEWEPVTPPDTIQQRSDRVTAAREHITIPPLAGEHGTDAPDRREPSIWLESFRPFLYGTLALSLVFALVLCNEPEPREFVNINIESSAVGFPLPEAPFYASLTENLAHQFACKALKSMGVNSRDWWTDVHPMDLRRVSDYEGTVVFRHNRDFFEVVKVTVKLEREEYRIVCTVDPQ
jgi:hypothetical protein